MLLAGCKHYRPAPLAPERTASAYYERSLDDPGLKAFVEKNLGTTLEPWPAPTWDFPTLTLVALYFHPSLDMARAQWDESKAGERTAGGRPNPTVGLAPAYNFNAASGTSPWMPGLTYDLPIETADKRAHRISQARHLSDAARLGIAETAWQVRSGLRGALLEFAAAERRAVILKRQRELQVQLMESFGQRVAAGAASAPEFLSVRLALLKTGSALAEAERMASEARARIGEAVGLSLDALAGAGFQFDLTRCPEREGLGGVVTSDQARQALRTRPDLRMALAEYAASETALRLEIAKQYPDIHLGTGYQWDQGENKWSLGLTVELPVLNRNQGPIAEAEAKRARLAAQFVALQAKVIAEIDRAMVNWSAAESQLIRMETVLGVEEDQLARVKSALSVGAADRVEFQTAGLEMNQAELGRLEAQLKWHQALGQVEDALRRPFAGIEGIEAKPSSAATKFPGK